MKQKPQLNRLRDVVSLLCFLNVSGTPVLRATDWPQYRGPNHDGISTEMIRTNWSEEAPRRLWKVPLGPALSSLAIGGGRVFTQVRRAADGGDQEFCVALSADTGAELWTSSPLDTAFYPHGGVGPDDGPRSTPSVDGDRVFVLTSYLKLFCLEAATGREIWSKDLKTEYGATVIAWQSAASPLVIGDLVIIHGNAPDQCLLAFRKLDGSLAWKGQSDGMTQATPVAATIRSTLQVIFFAQSGLVSVAPATGAVLWRFAVGYNGTSVAASPVVAGDQVYCSRAYPLQAGALVVSVTNSGNSFSATQVWSKPNQLMNHWCTPVHYNGHLYGMYGQASLTFKCVEMATGSEKWSVDGFGYGSVLVVSGKILALADNGELVLVDPNPAAYTVLARHQPLTGKCWNVAAISNGRIYVRSTTEAVALDVAVKVTTPLKLRPGTTSDGGAFQLFIGNEDSSPLAPNRVANIDIFATTNLTLGLGGWNRITTSPVLTNGVLRLDDPDSGSTPQRFFRVEERP
jgi:outer membrane protein assembly factor BamB